MGTTRDTYDAMQNIPPLCGATPQTELVTNRLDALETAKGELFGVQECHDERIKDLEKMMNEVNETDVNLDKRLIEAEMVGQQLITLYEELKAKRERINFGTPIVKFADGKVSIYFPYGPIDGEMCRTGDCELTPAEFAKFQQQVNSAGWQLNLSLKGAVGEPELEPAA